MSTTVTFNGQNYSVPANLERRGTWGTSLSLYLIALSTGALSKAGGNFTLTADVDFGANYGLKSAYFKSRSSNIASTGIVRVANNEAALVARNAANSADKALRVNASDLLEFDGVVIPTISSTSTLTGKTIDGDDNTVQDLPVTAIKTVLADANKAVVRDASGIPTSALIVNSNIDAAAAIARSKVATGTASHVLVNDGSGNLSSEAQLDKTRGGTGISSTATFPASGTVVTRDATETLTNKTLTSPTINTPTIDVATLDGQASAPANPSAGNYKTYVSDSDGKLHILDSNGNDQAVGSGSSGRNYLSDWFDAAKDIGTVTNSLGDTLTSSDRTANKTTWGSSDTSLLTIARSASSPLRQTYSYLITEAGASAGAFIESPLFSLDAVDLGKPVTVSFDVADNAVSDDYQVYMCRYDSNDVLQERIVIVGTASATSPYSARIPTGTTKFQGFFIAGSASTDQYALRIVSNSSSAASIKVDSLYVGPEKVVQGAAVTDWVSFTPTGSWSTNATYTGKWRRVGDSMECEIYIALSGAPTGTLSALNLPSGYTIDTAKLNQSTTSKDSIGSIGIQAAGTANYMGTIAYSSTTAVRPFVINAGGTYAVDSSITATAPNTFANGDFVSAHFKVPIAGWSSNITMADRAVEEQCATSSTWDADDTGLASLVRGYVGGAITGALTTSRTKRVRFNTPIQVNDNIEIKFARGSGQVYTLSAQFIDASGNRIVNSESSLQTISTSSGVYWRPVSGSNTDIDVIFARYAALANDDSPAQDWVNGWYWTANKVSGGAAVGYPIGARNIVGDTTGTTVPAGYIGEVISATITGETLDTTEEDVDGASITLTPGVWQIYYSCSVYITTGATSGNNTLVMICITDSSNTHVGKSERILSAKATAAVSNLIDGCVACSAVVSISSSTTYKLRGKRTDSVGTGTAGIYGTAGSYDSSFYAVRIA